MTTQEIIQKINEIVSNRSSFPDEKLSVDLESASYIGKTNFKFELSNFELPNKLNTHYFKVDTIESVGEIWISVTRNSNADIDKILGDAVLQFNIDLTKDLFLVIKTQ